MVSSRRPEVEGTENVRSHVLNQEVHKFHRVDPRLRVLKIIMRVSPCQRMVWFHRVDPRLRVLKIAMLQQSYPPSLVVSSRRPEVEGTENDFAKLREHVFNVFHRVDPRLRVLKTLSGTIAGKPFRRFIA